MNPIIEATRQWYRDAATAWDRFWFTPAPPQTVALLRILGGAMIFYTHLAWGLQLNAFLGKDAWVDNATALELQRGWFTWSHLWYIDSPVLLWTAHLAALVVMAMFTLGLFTRTNGVLTCLLTLAYCHRLHGALFGLDQVNAMLAMYLMLAPCGDAYSLDRYFANLRNRGSASTPAPTVMSNIAIRLIQLHLCILYLFGGISKLRGDMWWDGSAVWFALATLEYQSLNLTWLARFPWVIALMTHVTIFWETFYCFMVWPKWSRPITLTLAFVVHGGIALALGMKTFGLAMIIANLAFVSPELVAKLVGRCFGKPTGQEFDRAGEGERNSAPARVNKPSDRKVRMAASR